MVKVVYFFVCDSISNEPRGGRSVLTITAPQISLRPQVLPSNFSFGVAAGVVGVDAEKKNTIQFKIMAPNGKMVHDTKETPLPTGEKDNKLPEEWQGMMMAFDIRNLLFEEEGIYRFNLYVNGNLLEEHLVPVYRRV